MNFVPGLVLLAAVLTGCGGSSSSDLSAAAESILQRDADTLASAARARDGVAVQAALVALRRDVAAQQQSGGVSAARAQLVLAAAATLARDVPPPAPRPSPTPSPTPESDKDEEPSERGKGRKH